VRDGSIEREKNLTLFGEEKDWVKKKNLNFLRAKIKKSNKK